jgi:hypothetical protein
MAPPDETYWELDPNQNLKDIMATYNKNIQVNNAILDEASRLVPKAGYDRSNLYVVPTYGELETNTELSGKYNQPAPPININISSSGAPTPAVGTVVMMRNPKYKNPSPAIRISREVAMSIWDMTADTGIPELQSYQPMNLETMQLAPIRIGSGSGPVEGDRVLVVNSLGTITGPYGTADNTYATADQDPELPGFTGTISTQMDFRADCDPAYQFIARSTPRTFGYTMGYLDGDGTAPNGLPTGAGIVFPQNPQVGDYFLRIDYLPNILYRWDGRLWVRISENVRTQTGFTSGDLSQTSSFINNSNVTVMTDGTTTTQAQPLSSILTITPDPIPPVI